MVLRYTDFSKISFQFSIMTVKNNVKNNVKNIVNVTNVPLENDPSKMYTVVMYAKESGSSRRYVKFIFRVLPTKNLDMIGAEDVDLNIINMRNFLFAAQQGVTIHQLKLSVSDADYMDFYKEFVKRANGKDKNTRFMLDGTARMVRDRIP